jgi:hypothetical protein
MPWELEGNPNTNPESNFLGTTDPQPLVIRTNGAERVRVAPDGSVSVGTSSGPNPELGGPLAPLQVVRPDHVNLVLDVTSTTDHLTMVAGQTGSGLRFSDGNFFFVGSQPYANRNDISAGTMHLKIEADGRVGIGTDSPGAKLDVNGDARVAGTLRWGNSAAYADSIELGAPDHNSPGVATPFIDFHFQGKTEDYNTRIINDADGQLTVAARTLRATGDVWANDVVLASDARLKHDVVPVTNVLDKLQRICAVAYVKRDPEAASGSVSSRRDIGVLAQEVEGVFPGLVGDYGEDGLKGVRYHGLTAVLVEACKELHQQNLVLQRRVAALEGMTSGGPRDHNETP